MHEVKVHDIAKAALQPYLIVPGYSKDHTSVGRLLGLGRRRGDMDGQATDALAIQDKLSVALREITEENNEAFLIKFHETLTEKPAWV
jgi:hypothetical protein